MSLHIRLVSMLSLMLATNTIQAAEHSQRDAFVEAWRNRGVTLTRTLYSIVYSERSRFLPIVRRDGRVSGLTVATPRDTYYEFEARRDYEEDVVERDPDRILAALQDRYRRSAHLDEGTVQDIEPAMLVRYEPGVRLVVGRVRIERDRLRLFLYRENEHDLATTLTVKMPAPLSRELSEAQLIERVLARFLIRQ